MSAAKGTVSLVTGGSKGIGFAVAERLLQAGSRVAICARSSADLERACEALDPSGERVLGVPCDVSDPVACEQLVATTAERFGGLDILINNAGMGSFAPIQEMTVEQWRRMIDTNLGGVFYCSRAAVPHLKAGGRGWIINIASLASRNAFAGGVGYNASKFGLLGMTEAMMLDLRYDGIRTSVIMPGSVNTYFNGREPASDQGWKLQSEDVARAVLDLLEYPANALPSKIELRPSAPPRA